MKEGLLAVSFGTSVKRAQESIQAMETALRQAFFKLPFYTAYTSPTIRRILSGRGQVISDLDSALETMAAQGVRHAIVQPTHMLCGIEYEKMLGVIEQKRSLFAKITFGRPLLSETQDLLQLAQILSREYPKQEGEALVLFGHGTEHLTNVVYPALQTVFHMNGRKDVLVGTVEGWPGLEEILRELGELSTKNVHLVPMMVVAGDHACNDMAGEEPDSWKSRLEREGYQVRCTLSGLGMLAGVQQMAVEHLHESLRDAAEN